MSDPAQQAPSASQPVCHCLEQAVPRDAGHCFGEAVAHERGSAPACHCSEQAVPNRRREFLRTAGRTAALAAIAWLGGGVILRSWNAPAGTSCPLAAACRNCAGRERCDYPEVRAARQRAE